MEELIYSGNNIEDFTPNFYAPWKKGLEELNSLKFRSDEFILNHDGKHIIFSGCSNTFGVGLEKEETWAWKTYQKIMEKEKCSGFFNLGAGGTGIAHMVINIFKYCKKYGNPNIIFMNLSNQNRMFHYVKNGYKLKFNDNEDFNNIKLLNYQYYFMLEQYCRSNSIKLYSFTWDSDGFIKLNRKEEGQSTNYLFKLYNFKTFHYYPYTEMIKDLDKLQKTENNEYFIKARDGSHFGTGYNTIWANFIYEKYINDNFRN